MHKPVLDNVLLQQVLDSANRAISFVISRTGGAKRDRLSAERADIIQDTVLSVLTHWDEVRGTLAMIQHNEIVNSHAKLRINMGYKHTSSSPIAAFAWTVSKNLAIDFLNGRKMARGLLNHDSWEMPVHASVEGRDVTLGEVTRDREPSAYDKLARCQRDQWLMEEINALPRAQRDALLSVASDEDTKGMGLAFRQNKFRAVERVIANLPKGLRGKSIRSKHKGKSRKRAGSIRHDKLIAV